MPPETFAGDKKLAMKATISRNKRPETIIGYLNLNNDCFNKQNVATARLNNVRLLFSGVLNEIEQDEPKDSKNNTDKSNSNKSDKQNKQDKQNNKANNNKNNAQPEIKLTPLVTTTKAGNSFKCSPLEFMMLNPEKLMNKFFDGKKPVVMGYLATGRFKSAFPQGIEIEVNSEPNDPNETPKKIKKHISGLAQAKNDCAVVVFADVDFITDNMAYQDSIFGKLIVGDNSAMLLNAIESLTGSTELISIRSRGSYKRPFTVVDKIEKQAEAETAEQVSNLNAQIMLYNQQLNKLLNSSQQNQKQQDLIGNTIIQKRRNLELKMLQAKRQLREVQRNKFQKIDSLGRTFRSINMCTAPAVILLIAIVIGIRRNIRKRYHLRRSGRA